MDNFLLTILIVSILTILLECVRIVPANQKAVRDLLGHIIGVKESGLRLKWPFVEKFVFYPQDLQEIDLEELTVATQEGDDKFGHYGSILLKIQVSLRYFWPDENGELMRVYKEFPRPNETEKIESIVYDPVFQALTTAAGYFIYPELQRKTEKLKNKAKEVLTNERTDAFKKAGFRDFDIAISNIEWPKDIEEARKKRELARRNKEAAIEEAEGRKKAIILEGEGTAQARKILFSAIGEKDMEKEAMYTTRSIFDSPSSKFVVISDAVNKLVEQIGMNIKGGKKK